LFMHEARTSNGMRGGTNESSNFGLYNHNFSVF